MNLLQNTLTKYWGYSSFLPLQEDIIEAILAKNDVIAVLPTGGGKSLCFQLPAMISEGVCLVISPLIALIEDQIAQLNEKNIKALSIVSNASKNEIIRIFDNLDFGDYKFLYLSPERLQSKFVQDKLTQININFVVIDEAHCISEWGHDFRPAYRKINALKTLLPETNFIAFTGTATKTVVSDIIQNLQLASPTVFIKSAIKKNIGIFIYKTEDKYSKLLQILQKLNAPAIVYTNSRRKTAEIASFLSSNRIVGSVYHAGLTSKEKKDAFKSWMQEKNLVMIATNAFGMGINKSNVKAVIHFDIPNSIENYIQEIGRAGRNHQKAYAFLLYNSIDIQNKSLVLKNYIPSIDEIKIIHQKLYQYFQIAKGELPLKSYDFDQQEFAKTYQFSLKKVNFTFQILANNFVVDIQNLQQESSSITFNFSTKQVLNYTIDNVYIKNFINSLLRNYSGLHQQTVKINEAVLANKNNIPLATVISYLQQLHTDGLLNYNPQKRGSKLQFLVPREDDRTINKIEPNIHFYTAQKTEKLNAIIHFITNHTTCKTQLIARYFEEEKKLPCGVCDWCLSKSNPPKVDIEKEILQILQKHQKATSKEICNQIHTTESQVLTSLQKLLANQIITINQQNYYYILKK